MDYEAVQLLMGLLATELHAAVAQYSNHVWLRVIGPRSGEECISKLFGATAGVGNMGLTLNPLSTSSLIRSRAQGLV